MVVLVEVLVRVVGMVVEVVVVLVSVMVVVRVVHVNVLVVVGIVMVLVVRSFVVAVDLTECGFLSTRGGCGKCGR